VEIIKKSSNVSYTIISEIDIIVHLYTEK